MNALLFLAKVVLFWVALYFAVMTDYPASVAFSLLSVALPTNAPALKIAPSNGGQSK